MSRRLSARDYKHARRGSFSLDATRLRDFGLGLAVGLAVAAAVFIGSHRRLADTAPARPMPSAATPDEQGLSPNSSTGSAASDVGSADAPRSAAHLADPGAPPEDLSGLGRYDFYQMLSHGQTLPRFELIEQGREQASQPAAATPVVRPGTYFLQVGSYRDDSSAQRVRAQVSRLGIAASVQRLTAKGQTWHRVRIGPVRDLALLNRLRHQLQNGHLDALVIRLDN